MAIAVVTGSFDPITLGHLDIIGRAHSIFGRLIVGVGVNPEKPSLWTPEERVRLVQLSIDPKWDVLVEAFEGLTVDFVRRHGARVIVRGVRSMADVDYELVMAQTNRSLAPEIETLFLPASPDVAYVSATFIKHIARWGDPALLRRYVPEPVIDELVQRVRGSASDAV